MMTGYRVYVAAKKVAVIAAIVPPAIVLGLVFLGWEFIGAWAEKRR